MQFPPATLLCLFASVYLIGCGETPGAESAFTALAEDILVVERRPITAADEARIKAEPSTTERICSERGASVWDYDAIGPADEPGRVADDALRDAIDGLNDDAIRYGSDQFVPQSGWVELVEGPNASTFVHGATEWQFLVAVGGDADLGVWRHFEARYCLP